MGVDEIPNLTREGEESHGASATNHDEEVSRKSARRQKREVYDKDLLIISVRNDLTSWWRGRRQRVCLRT